MKVFWALVAGLLVAAGVVLALRGGGTEPEESAQIQPLGLTEQLSNSAASGVSAREHADEVEALPELSSPAPASKEEVEASIQVPEAENTRETTPGEQANAEMKPPAPTLDELLSLPAPESRGNGSDSAPEEGPGEVVEQARPAEVQQAADDPQVPTGPGGHHSGHRTPAVNPLAEAPIADGSAEESAEGSAGEDLGPPVVENADGTTLLDQRFTIKGRGTSEDPYQLTWELLISVRDSYQPRIGKDKLPEWTEFMNGKWVKLPGYMLLPVVGDQIDELLLMRNQWDGCCIGVPPTPYDAVEVTLASPPTGLSRWKMNYGSVMGKLRVDPYVRNNWLLGLYVLDEAAVETTGF